MTAFFVVSAMAGAQTTIVEGEQYSWGENIGWLDWRGDGEHGVGFGRRIAHGFLYSANIGWINLGNGAPEDGLQYSNASGDDFGVNVREVAEYPDDYVLSGYAWSESSGWLTFDVGAAVGFEFQPRIEKATGLLKGYAWSGNVGWIALESSAFSSLRTESLGYLLVLSAEHGAVMQEPLGNGFAAGTTVTLWAEPGMGYHFVRWSGDVPQGHEAENPLLLTVEKDTYIEAVIAINQYALDLRANAGVIDASPVLGMYPHDTSVTLSVRAWFGFEFVGWTGDVPAGQEGASSITLLVDSPKSLTARFSTKPTESIIWMVK